MERVVNKDFFNPAKPEFFIKDHLGNTRVVVKDSNGKAEVMQESHYYPFGMTMEGMSYSGLLSGVEANKYLYNGKELQDDLGLDWYDYGARFYDAQLGRWHSVDPHTESYFSFSPYNYVYNNPMAFVDPTGMDPEQDFYDDMEENNKKFKEWIESHTSSYDDFGSFSRSNNKNSSNNSSTTTSNNPQGGGEWYLFVKDGKLVVRKLKDGKVPNGAIKINFQDAKI
jgi:RHS repeat-associated protein